MPFLTILNGTTSPSGVSHRVFFNPTIPAAGAKKEGGREGGKEGVKVKEFSLVRMQAVYNGMAVAISCFVPIPTAVTQTDMLHRYSISRLASSWRASQILPEPKWMFKPGRV